MADVRREMERLRPVYETGVLRLLLRGNSMLYNLTDLLRNTQEDQVNFARCVYLLARLRPHGLPARPGWPKPSPHPNAYCRRFRYDGSARVRATP